MNGTTSKTHLAEYLSDTVTPMFIIAVGAMLLTIVAVL